MPKSDVFNAKNVVQENILFHQIKSLENMLFQKFNFKSDKKTFCILNIFRSFGSIKHIHVSRYSDRKLNNTKKMKRQKPLDLCKRCCTENTLYETLFFTKYFIEQLDETESREKNLTLKTAEKAMK